MNIYELSKMSPEERKDFLEAYATEIKDMVQHGELISSLQKWIVNVERVIKQHNSNDGNSLDSLETKVSKVEGLITKFNLELLNSQHFVVVLAIGGISCRWLSFF